MNHKVKVDFPKERSMKSKEITRKVIRNAIIILTVIITIWLIFNQMYGRNFGRCLVPEEYLQIAKDNKALINEDLGL